MSTLNRNFIFFCNFLLPLFYVVYLLLLILFVFIFPKEKVTIKNRIVYRAWMMKKWSLQQSTYFHILWSSVRPWCESSLFKKHRLRMMWVCVVTLCVSSIVWCFWKVNRRCMMQLLQLRKKNVLCLGLWYLHCIRWQAHSDVEVVLLTFCNPTF